jgi:hypothetical protein
MLPAVLVLAAVLGAPAASFPPAPPSAAPPKTIVTVKSSALCAGLRENVAPALAGLIQNDGLIGYGRSTLLNIANESQHAPLSNYNERGAAQVASSTPRLGEGFSHLSDLARSIQRNTDRRRRFSATSFSTNLPARVRRATPHSGKARSMRSRHTAIRKIRPSRTPHSSRR